MLGAAAIPLTGVTGACASRVLATYYVSPNGEGDGSSWDQATNISAVGDLLNGMKAGEILFAADHGEYQLDRAIEISAGGGRADTPIRLRGVHSETGAPAAAILRGDRRGGDMGVDAFRLLDGAGNLHFSHFDFRAIGNGCVRVAGNVSGLLIEDCSFDDIYRFLENGGADDRQAPLRQFVVRRCAGTRVERGFLRVRYASRDGLIEDCRAEGTPNEGGHIPAGCALDDRASNITFRRCVMENFQQWRAGDYWNGDGFSDEENNSGIRYEACEARGATDGGFDCKSRDVTLVDCIAEDNKRNFRIWSAHATLSGCTSRTPNFRGDGVEQTESSHVWIGGDNARIDIAALTVIDSGAAAIFEFEHDTARVALRGVTIEAPRRNWNASLTEHGDALIVRQD